MAAAFVAGFAVRLALVSYKGTADMDTYLDWGRQTRNLGLPSAYTGIYFPIEFQLFGFAVGVADLTRLSGVGSIKALNLAFDTGTFAVLLLLLRRWRAPAVYALLYWLSPFFLAIYWLGYVDAQLAFFLVSFLLLVSLSRGGWGDVAAGIPLGVLLLLKPQGALALATVVLFIVVAVLRHRIQADAVLRVARMMVAPVLLFAAYSLWIGTSALHSPLYLTQTVLETRSHMPSLSANMTNVWLIVATFYRSGSEPIYAVTRPDVFHHVGLLATVVLIVWAVAWIAPRIASRPLDQQLACAIAVGMMIYPMTATAAHENHLFVGLLSLILVAAFLRDRRITVLLVALLTVQFLHLFGLYRFGLNDLTPGFIVTITKAYSPEWRAVVAAVSVLLFVGLAAALARALNTTIAERA